MKIIGRGIRQNNSKQQQRLRFALVKLFRFKREMACRLRPTRQSIPSRDLVCVCVSSNED